MGTSRSADYPRPMTFDTLDTPLGPLTLVASGVGLRQVRFGAPPPEADRGDDPALGPRCDGPGALVLHEATDQLTAWFDHGLLHFDLPLELVGTPFQRSVWGAVRHVGYGETTTYAALAAAVGRPGGAQAVGGANGANPLPIVIPCHRVIGATGGLVGYVGGLEVKRWLLGHEAAWRQPGLF